MKNSFLALPRVIADRLLSKHNDQVEKVSQVWISSVLYTKEQLFPPGGNGNNSQSANLSSREGLSAKIM